MPRKKTIKSKPNFGEIIQQLTDAIKQLFHYVIEWGKDMVDLDEGADVEGTIINIRENKEMRGANAWLLIASIMIASLGLYQNSPAVIIGAMLISPLMSPILGVGLSIAINDKKSLWISLQHFITAVLIALGTSFIFFKLADLDAPTEEILSRVKPTLFDFLIAVFGGLAGIISSSKRDKSNAIPGVAIATALMPPLCVSGYGLAVNDLSIALNSFYLFFLNSFYIALTTYIMCWFLGFPLVTYLDKKEGKRTRRLLLLVSLLILIPSLYIQYKLKKNENENEQITLFMDQNFGHKEDTQCLKYYLDEKDDGSKVLTMQLWGKRLSSIEMKQYENEFTKLEFDNILLNLQQEENVTVRDIEDVASKLNTSEEQLLANEKAILFLKTEFNALKKEKIIRDSISDLRNSLISAAKEAPYKVGYIDILNLESNAPYVIVKWKEELSKSDELLNKEEVSNLIKERTQLEIMKFEILK